MDRHAPRPIPPRGSAAWAVIARGCVVPFACRPQQAALLRERMRALAPVVAALVLAWIPIDLIGLNTSELAWIVPLRLALALGLLRLAQVCLRLSARSATMRLVWLQAIAFGAMQLCLEPTRPGALPGQSRTPEPLHKRGARR